MANGLPDTALAEAIRIVGSGPVTMVNLLRFWDMPRYQSDFADKKDDVRSAYYGGYAGEFREVASKLGISTQLIHAGKKLHGLLQTEADNWDDIVIVRYESLLDLQAIIENEHYKERAVPHRLAAVADWRFIATAA